jgi:cystathionine beta-lyase/cystathionine gamma-synthase
MNPEPRAATICSRAQSAIPSSTKPLVTPLDLSVVYRFESLDHVDAHNAGEPGFSYARDGHPNATALAEKIAKLEGAERAIVCASGMGVTAAVVLGLLKTGDHVAIAEQHYGKTGLLFSELSRFGVETTTYDATRPETLKHAMRPTTRLVFAETISNPLVRVADLAALESIAHAGGALLVVDHTFAPLLCRPIGLGADFVYHSATKLIGGHSDLTLGVMAGPAETLHRLATVASTFGVTGNPFECWLAMRGLATLAIRVERTSASALELASRLMADPRLREVHYPGLAGHPDHELATRMFEGGFGAMMAIDLGSRSRVDQFIRSLKHIPFAPSLGDVSTTLSHPATTSHRTWSAEERLKRGIGDGLVRLSVGLEDVEDLWADIDAALPGSQAGS